MPLVKTFQLECPEACSLRPGSKVGQKVTEMMLAGVAYRQIVDIVKKEDDWVLYPATMTRHKKHVRVTGTSDPDDAPLGKANNIEILETIIQKGFQNSKNWKPTIGDTMKAMDMWFRLTQGNPFDDLLDTLASAALGEEETNPDATGTPTEVETAVSSIDDDEEEAALAVSA